MRAESLGTKAPLCSSTTASSCAGLYRSRFIIGPLMSEVTTAITTSATKIGSLMTPASSARSARMISIAPRAFSPKPTAADSRQPSPPSRAPIEQPSTLATLAMTTTSTVMRRSKEWAKSTRRPSPAKNTGANTLVTKSWMTTRVRSRRWRESPTAMPTRKAPSTACTPSAWVIAPPKRARHTTSDSVCASPASLRNEGRPSSR